MYVRGRLTIVNVRGIALGKMKAQYRGEVPVYPSTRVGQMAVKGVNKRITCSIYRDWLRRTWLTCIKPFLHREIVICVSQATPCTHVKILLTRLKDSQAQFHEFKFLASSQNLSGDVARRGKGGTTRATGGSSSAGLQEIGRFELYSTPKRGTASLFALTPLLLCLFRNLFAQNLVPRVATPLHSL